MAPLRAEPHNAGTATVPQALPQIELKSMLEPEWRERRGTSPPNP
jgi:hypothetical protein